MKYIKLLAITLSVAVIVNCAKKEDVKTYEQYEENGVKITKNNGIPADSTLELNLKKVFTINNQVDSITKLMTPVSIIEDKDQNIYVLDFKERDIKKFNNLGEFQKTIGREGQGPGEFHYPAIMFINNDTLTVYNNGSRKISKFNLDGKFYYEKAINGLGITDSRQSPNGKNLIYHYTGHKMGKINYDLIVVDLVKMKKVSTLDSLRFTMEEFMAGKFYPADEEVPYCIGNEMIYLSDGTDYQYKFIGYDLEGNKNEEVKKPYRKVRYKDTEKDEYISKKASTIRKNKDDVKAPEFKKAIHAIHVDKYGRVLVIPIIDHKIDEEGVYIDIFKDGIFLNRVDYYSDDKNVSGVLWETSGEVYFAGTRMYFVNSEDMSIDVYDY